MILAVLSLFVFLACACGDVLLNNYPMIMSHDAATGEIVEDRDHIVDDWAQTQAGGLIAQLDCGSRSYDYRPYYKDGSLFAHHGGVKIHKPMSESIDEVSQWCNDHDSELVIFYVTACEGDSGCTEASVDLLKSKGIKTISNCDDLNGMTVSTAISISALPKGGHLLAIIECVNEQYDPSLGCYGAGYDCYDTPASVKPWAAFTSYMHNATSISIPSLAGKLWMAQAHWQSSAVTVTLGTLHRSSLLLDESRSAMNTWVAQHIRANKFQNLNIVEVDNVCDNGLEIFNAIQDRKKELFKH